ncbi:MAG: SDR family oxidoreductase [Planctomycetota bacterium]
MEIRGRTAIVTGSGSGIGRAIAIEFARNGAHVVCCSRRREKLEETAAIIKKGGGSAIAVQTDVTRQGDVRRMVKETIQRFGKIDVLFNNAGSFQSIAGVWEAESELWWTDVSVNLLGAFLCIREALPGMMERDEGIIINMNGGRPTGGTGYACGKAGLMELTRILVEELKIAKSRVMVFGAGPGLVRTEMTELQASTESGRKWIPSTAECFETGKVRQPEEIAEATMEMIRVARIELSGISYDPGTDFRKFRR